LGIGDWGLGPIPNPQSPIPNPQSPIPNSIIIFLKFANFQFLNIIIIILNKINLMHAILIFILICNIINKDI
jgi:hypothetical protein